VQHYLQQDETQHALDAARQVQGAEPRNPAVLQLLAMAQLKAGKNKEAIATLRTLTEVMPDSPEALYQLALVQLKQKESDAARNSLERAIRLQEDFPQAQAALGRLDIARKEYDAALKIATVLQKNHPDAAYGYELEGDVHTARGDTKETTASYALAYEKTASAQLAQKLFQSRLQAGEYKSAYMTLREWLADNPEDVNTRKLLALSLQDAGQQEQATDEYLKILEVDTDNVIVLNNLAWLYQEAGNPEGIKYARRAHELVPGRPEVTDTLGWLLVQNGDINQGLVLLQEAAVKAPHIPDIRYHMVVALDKAGRRDEARKELDRLLKTGTTFTDVDKARALRDQWGR